MKKYYFSDGLRFNKEKHIPTRSHKIIKKLKRVIAECQGDFTAESMEKISLFVHSEMNAHLRDNYRVETGFVPGNNDGFTGGWWYGFVIGDSFHGVDQEEIDKVKSLKEISSVLNSKINITYKNNEFQVTVWSIICHVLQQQAQENYHG